MRWGEAHLRLKRLYDERVPPGMTQREFGKRYGIGSQSMVGQYLNGAKPLNFEAAAKFAKGLQCTIYDISPEMAETVRHDILPVLGLTPSTPVIPITLATRIRARREELGLSSTELARAARVSSAAVHQWESGETKNLKHEHLFVIADVLKLDPRWLALGDGLKADVPSETAALDSNEIARRLCVAMDSRAPKLTLAELARACGVTTQAVHGWRSTGRIAKKHLSRIALETGKSLEFFLEVGRGESEAAAATASGAFCDRLRAAAEYANIEYSQSAIAKVLGAPRQTVFQWFHGKTEPTAAMVFRIAKRWDVDPSWLATGEGEMIPTGR